MSRRHREPHATRPTGRRRPVDRRLDILRIMSDRGDESIALAGQRLDELRMVGRIAQRVFLHGLFQSVNQRRRWR